jgi:multiple sugar transport system permease protein
VIIGGFHVWPLLYAAWVSLHEWKIRPGELIGLANYHQALTAGGFWQSVLVTGWYVLGTVPPTLLLAYLIAELLNRKIPGRDVYRVLFFTPYIVSPVAAAAVWKWVFYSASPPVNQALIDHGLTTLPNQTWLLQPRGIFLWLAQGLGHDLPRWAHGPSLALCCIMVVTIWTSLGFAVVVLLGGLSQVPTEVLEAAQLDGATGWRLRRHVIWPMLSPVLFFLLIVFTIRAFQAFSQIYVFTGENNLLGTTSTLTFYIYETAFRGAGARGYGSAVAFLLFGIILALTWLQFVAVGKRVHYGGGE